MVVRWFVLLVVCVCTLLGLLCITLFLFNLLDFGCDLRWVVCGMLVLWVVVVDMVVIYYVAFVLVIAWWLLVG